MYKRIFSDYIQILIGTKISFLNFKDFLNLSDKPKIEKMLIGSFYRQIWLYRCSKIWSMEQRNFKKNYITATLRDFFIAAIAKYSKVSNKSSNNHKRNVSICRHYETLFTDGSFQTINYFPVNSYAVINMAGKMLTYGLCPEFQCSSIIGELIAIGAAILQANSLVFNLITDSLGSILILSQLSENWTSDNNAIQKALNFIKKVLKQKKTEEIKLYHINSHVDNKDIMFQRNDQADAFAKMAIAQNVPTDKLTQEYFLKEENNNYINSWETKFKFNGFIGGFKSNEESLKINVEKLYFALDPLTRKELHNFIKCKL